MVNRTARTVESGRSGTQPLRSLVRAHGPLIAPLACALAWLFLARFSALLLQDAPAPTASNAVAVITLAVLTAGSLAFRPLSALVSTRRGSAAVLWAAAGSAALASLMPWMAGALGLPSPAYLVCIGLLSGAALLGFAALALRWHRAIGNRASLAVAAASFTLAFAVYCTASWALSGDLAPFSAALPVASALLLSRASDRGHGCPDGSAALPCKAATPRSPLFGAFLALAASLAVYMPTMYPKTTNGAPVQLGAEACLGLASWRSISALALCCLLLWLIADLAINRPLQGVRPPRSGIVTVAALLGISLFAAIFFFLPFMGTSPLPFVLITACAIVFALLALAELAQRSYGGDHGLDKLGRGLAVMCSTGLATGAFALIFLGPLYGKTNFQDALFSLVPAVLFIALLSVAFCLRDQLSVVKTIHAIEGAEGTGRENNGTSLEELCANASRDLGLTKRESEVLALIAAGRNEPYIEEALGISKTTVKTHIAHIYRKAGVTSRQQLLDLLHGA